jgi:hypothetical protein
LNIYLLYILKFEQESVTAPYKGKPQQLDVWVRPMWTWIEDMLQNEDLIDHFEWDACQRWRFDEDEDSWVRFYDEPWTADRFWEIQVCSIYHLLSCVILIQYLDEKSNLPPGAKPLMLSLYADKSKLSSFGTQKGYPVIARCANLPVEIRNGNGLGGGRVVGWLPIVRFDIYYCPHFSYLMISLRLRKMQLSLKSQAMSASNV